MRLRSAPSLLAALAVAGGAGLAACTGGSAGGDVALHVTPAESVADQPVSITVSGLTPGTAVSLRLRSTDATHTVWSSSATFRASAAGSVNPARMAARSGSYTGRSAMGLFWSLEPPLAGPAAAYYWPGTRPAVFDLSVSAHDTTLASVRLTRHWLVAPTSAGAHTVAASGFDGQFFPPRGVPAGQRRPAVLIIGGSQGGLSSPLLAAALAAHGYPALDIAYFAAPDLPGSLSDIPLEYFARALRWLRRQPQVDPAHGPSRPLSARARGLPGGRARRRVPGALPARGGSDGPGRQGRIHGRQPRRHRRSLAPAAALPGRPDDR